MCALYALLVACHGAFPQSNGYVLSSRTPFAAAATQVAFDAADPPVAKLKAGFTIWAWLRPYSSSPTQGGSPFTIAHSLDINMMQVFSQSGAGFLFGTGAPVAIKDNFVQTWTHVALTHDTASSNVQVFVDGVQQPGSVQVQGSIPVDTQAVRLQMFVNACLSQDYAVATNTAPSAPFQCDLQKTYSGDLDDFALFNRVLTADDVAVRWNASLTDRIAAGLEP